MKDFFKKYKVLFRFLEIIFFIIWATFILIRFSEKGNGMDMIGGGTIAILSLFKAYDFYQLYKKTKEEKRANAVQI